MKKSVHLLFSAISGVNERRTSTSPGANGEEDPENSDHQDDSQLDEDHPTST